MAVKTKFTPSTYSVLGYTKEDFEELSNAKLAIDIVEIKKKQQAILDMGKVNWNDPILRKPFNI